MCHCIVANVVILNWQRPLREGDGEVVKRYDKDEPIWVNTHMHGNNTRNLPV
jgi:hypothetical protein